MLFQVKLCGLGRSVLKSQENFAIIIFICNCWIETSKQTWKWNGCHVLNCRQDKQQQVSLHLEVSLDLKYIILKHPTYTETPAKILSHFLQSLC